MFYALLALARYWAGPVNAQASIDLHPSALPRYAAFSLARIILAYVLSFAFTLVYAYIAAHNKRAERILVPLLRHVAIHPGAELPSGRNAGDGFAVSDAPARSRTGRHSVDPHRPGLEHDLQRVCVDEVHSSRDAGSRGGLSPELVAEAGATGTALRGDRLGVEFHDVGGRRVVFPDGLRNVRARAIAICVCPAWARICRPPPTRAICAPSGGG